MKNEFQEMKDQLKQFEVALQKQQQQIQNQHEEIQQLKEENIQLKQLHSDQLDKELDNLDAVYNGAGVAHVSSIKKVDDCLSTLEERLKQLEEMLANSVTQEQLQESLAGFNGALKSYAEAMNELQKGNDVELDRTTVSLNRLLSIYSAEIAKKYKTDQEFFEADLNEKLNETLVQNQEAYKNTACELNKRITKTQRKMDQIYKYDRQDFIRIEDLLKIIRREHQRLKFRVEMLDERCDHNEIELIAIKLEREIGKIHDHVNAQYVELERFGFKSWMTALGGGLIGFTSGFLAFQGKVLFWALSVGLSSSLLPYIIVPGLVAGVVGVVVFGLIYAGLRHKYIHDNKIEIKKSAEQEGRYLKHEVENALKECCRHHAFKTCADAYLKDLKVNEDTLAQNKRSQIGKLKHRPNLEAKFHQHLWSAVNNYTKGQEDFSKSKKQRLCRHVKNKLKRHGQETNDMKVKESIQCLKKIADQVVMTGTYMMRVNAKTYLINFYKEIERFINDVEDEYIPETLSEPEKIKERSEYRAILKKEIIIRFEEKSHWKLNFSSSNKNIFVDVLEAKANLTRKEKDNIKVKINNLFETLLGYIDVVKLTSKEVQELLKWKEQLLPPPAESQGISWNPNANF